MATLTPSLRSQNRRDIFETTDGNLFSFISGRLGGPGKQWSDVEMERIEVRREDAMRVGVGGA